MNLLGVSVNFSENYVWTFAIQLAILFGAILIGNIIRTKIKFIRKLLIPSSLIGGLLILIIKMIPGLNKIIDGEMMQIITYHCLGLGFAAMTLKTVKSERKVSTTKVIESGIIMASSYLIQAVTGIIVSLIFFFLMDYFYGAGLILPMGYGQGTGSALSWGSKFENSYGFTGGASFGLTIATVGFLVGSIVGVIYINILNAKGKLSKRSIKTRIEHLHDYVSNNEIPNSESVDKLTIQICFVAIVYIAAFGFMSLLELTGVQAINDLAWGLNFLWALVFAFLFKLILNALKKKGTIKRYYINNYLMDRISGFMFDMMIIAGTAAIDFEDIRITLPLLIVMCTVGAIVSFIYVYFSTKATYKNYEAESFLTNFGTVTGTASTGIILLREIDPAFETPAASNIVLQNIPSIPLLAPLLLTIGFAASSLTNTIIMLGVYLVLFIVYNIFLFRRKIFKKHYNSKPEEIWTPEVDEETQNEA